MPKALENTLKTEATKKGLSGDSANAYIYGTMQKMTNWKPPGVKKVGFTPKTKFSSGSKFF